jgi:outer membrane receptor protein involved in Fe transport
MTTGLYVEDDWTLGTVVLTAGARADYWTISRGRFTERNATTGAVTTTLHPERDDWEGSVRAGLLWRASDRVALRAAGYTSFRLPTINELYRGFAVFPVVTQANAGLAPERLKGGEAGFDLTPTEGVRFSATAFYNRLDNAIANVTIGTNLRQRRNVDAVIAKGLELTGSVDVGTFDLSASYAFSDSEVEASGAGAALNGKRPAQSPRHSASATLGWRAPANARLAVTARYVGPQFEDDLEVDRMPGVTTIDGFARLPITDRIAVIGRVENLFDVTVLTRKVGTSVDLGTPQTFWIGLQIGG